MRKAYSIAELVQLGPVGRSKLYELIASGKLEARKIGNKTFVLREHYEAMLGEAPKAEVRSPRQD